MPKKLDPADKKGHSDTKVELLLGTYLKAHELTVYRLAAHTKGQMARRTLYLLANGETGRLDLATLAKLIHALRELTGQPVEVQDLLRYRGGTDDQS